MFEEITLGQVGAFIVYLAGLAGAVTGIYQLIKKLMKALFKDQNAAIESIDRENCKNYLVSFLARVERGDPYDEIELERFHEQYEHYRNIHGNSYISSKVTKLQNAGKL